MAKKKLSKAKQYAREKRIVGIILFCTILSLILFVWLLKSTRKYNFVGAVFFPLWYVALALGVVAAIIFVWFFFKKISSGDKSGRKPVIGLSFAVVLVVFVIFGWLFAHINHIFDFNEPKRHVVVIEEINYDSGGHKSPGYYEFRVTIEGETEDIVVPRLHAYQFQEGDLYVVEYHKGAFNEPYYIGVGAPTDND